MQDHCTITDCQRPGRYKKGLCPLHYSRMWRTGHTEILEVKVTNSRDKPHTLEYQRAWRESHRQQLRDRQREWRGRWRENPENLEKHRQRRRQEYAEHHDRIIARTYGMGEADFVTLVARAGNRCEICRHEFSDKAHKRSVDHDHVTGHVRGLLCHMCNMALGGIGDNPDVLRAAIVYLEREPMQMSGPTDHRKLVDNSKANP